jgi:hypothetical protein
MSSLLDESTPWLLCRELASEARARLAGAEGAERAELARELTRSVQLELEVLDSREAVAIREVLTVIMEALA